MKKITLLAALFAVGFMSAQNILFQDDFESYTLTDPNTGQNSQIPADYLSYDVDGDGFNFGLTNPSSFTQPVGDDYSGNFLVSASYITGPNTPLSPDNIIVLPVVTIPSDATDASISYTIGSGTDPAFFSETYSVQVTTGNAQDDILAATPILSTTLSFQGSETVVLDLTSFAGQTVYVSFRHFDTTDQFFLGLDDIVIESDGTVLGLQDQSFAGFNYFVDANKQLNLSANTQIQSVELYNMIGQQVISQKLSNNTEIVNLASLSSGMYIAKVSIDGASKTFKIVNN